MRILLLSFLMLVGLSAQAQKSVDMKFDTILVDLGAVKHGENKAFQYKFTNNGTDNIEIDIVSGCSCTTTDWTKGIIKPGESGVIDVVFHSEEKDQSETVDVDVYLKNIDPEWNAGYLFELKYKFELIK